MSNSRLLAWELAGFIVIVALGIPLHSCFAWSGYRHSIAWLAPVNESTWEHFKLCFWPGVVFSLVEYHLIGKKAGSFWKAKAIGQVAMPLTITVVFYGYTAILGRHEVVADILVFVLGVAAGQYFSYRTLSAGAQAGLWWAAVILLMALVFVWFTYDPPHSFLHKDPITSGYGITHT